MSKLLTINNGNIVAIASDIVRGIYDEPDVEKYGLFDENGNIFLYVLYNSELVLHETSEPLPSDYTDGKYLYINGTFALNPDYVEPLPPIEDRVTEVESDIVSLTDSLMNTDLTAVGLYEQLLEQTDINTAQDETLIELYELIYT